MQWSWVPRHKALLPSRYVRVLRSKNSQPLSGWKKSAMLVQYFGIFTSQNATHSHIETQASPNSIGWEPCSTTDGHFSKTKRSIPARLSLLLYLTAMGLLTSRQKETNANGTHCPRNCAFYIWNCPQLGSLVRHLSMEWWEGREWANWTEMEGLEGPAHSQASGECRIKHGIPGPKMTGRATLVGKIYFFKAGWGAGCLGAETRLGHACSRYHRLYEL